MKKNNLRKYLRDNGARPVAHSQTQVPQRPIDTGDHWMAWGELVPTRPLDRDLYAQYARSVDQRVDNDHTEEV
jgi:hypothetical protein